jgi:hypothetical protein
VAAGYDDQELLMAARGLVANRAGMKARKQLALASTSPLVESRA